MTTCTYRSRIIARRRLAERLADELIGPFLGLGGRGGVDTGDDERHIEDDGEDVDLY